MYSRQIDPHHCRSVHRCSSQLGHSVELELLLATGCLAEECLQAPHPIHRVSLDVFRYQEIEEQIFPQCCYRVAMFRFQSSLLWIPSNL